ncbi:threonine ammonia-lyase, biosynthetic [Microbulbifer hydrolyticus]|uniref:L-threonine dehydratase n=1 Tax=Microbulbifer hydrolyticus TaxID=48074 RepID=A0A6P1T8F5_9GAMM|nr:threonine ammonia-lyase, biosynthetic [Microbulbifer hydrolyticus]MBB5211187.1 threonine dehydratase [Microbulbifer hydrolyticus]QHQ38041.1 threonine ammonia-lyase, biosynthetic [Microbulbifer hydrolyticus]
MPKSYIKRILDARIYDVAIETPLEPMRQMSHRLGNRVLLKREDLQPVFSFKIRGAYNKLLQLEPEQRAKGVICASAGNHAQGLALGAQQLGVRATIVMPSTTPAIKVNAVRMRGAEVVLHGDTFDEAATRARELVEERGLVFIHPYDDPDVIAGQGTVAMELLRQHPGNLDAVFIPVGGGGLAAGMAAYIKYVRPEIKVYAVEPEDAACLKLAMAEGNREGRLPQVGLFADGVAVRQIGEETFRVLRETIDGVITVTTDEICAAIKDIFEDTRSIAEPAGAVGLAGLKKYAEQSGERNQALATVCSGANTNFDRLRYISERTEIGEKREAVLAVTIPEKPGSYLQFCRDLGDRSITEFNYRYANSGEAHIFVGIQVSTDADRQQLVSQLQEGGYRVTDLTDNEMAKLHIRHLVGGRAPGIENEVVYRFEFPERPGALRKFLEQLAGRWNITLFHYRNHGAAYGRVLVGLEVAEAERPALKALLDQLHYPFWEETENPAYRFFLSQGR